MYLCSHLTAKQKYVAKSIMNEYTIGKQLHPIFEFALPVFHVC